MWAATVPPTLGWLLLFPKSWNRWGVEYVALLSVYALVKGAGGQEQAARAKEKAAEAADTGASV